MILREKQRLNAIGCNVKLNKNKISELHEQFKRKKDTTMSIQTSWNLFVHLKFASFLRLLIACFTTFVLLKKFFYYDLTVERIES